MAEIPQSEINDQLARKNEFNGDGLNAFMIIGICVCTVLVGLRFWSRKWVQHIGWHADDYTIVVALVSTDRTRALRSMPRANSFLAVHSCFRHNILYPR